MLNNLKLCRKCLEQKNLSDFPVKKYNKDGLYSYCKSCKSNIDRIYRSNNLEKKKKTDHNYYLNNKESHQKRCQIYYKQNFETLNKKNKEYYYSHRKEIFEQLKEKKKRDPIFKLICTFRSRTSSILKNKKIQKNNHFMDYIGCSLEELKNHLESKFQSGMTWENHSKFGWHVDHITPLSSAKTEEDVYKLIHYTNLQPLWALDNLRKGDKICRNIQPF